MNAARFTEQQCETLARGLLPRDEVRALGRDNVRAMLKGRTRYGRVKLEALGGKDEERRRRFAMIHERPLPPFDFIVSVGGIDLGEFEERGSPLMFAHGGKLAKRLIHEVPLGHVENIKKETRQGRRRMSGDTVFDAADPDLEFEEAQLVWRLVAADVLTSGSIGIDPDEEGERPPTEAEIKRFGIKNPDSFVIARSRLQEFSIVALGRDPSAGARIKNSLDSMCRSGHCKPETAREFMGRLTDSAVSGRSYHLMDDTTNGWAEGVDEGFIPLGPDSAIPVTLGCGCSEKLDAATAELQQSLDSLGERLGRLELVAGSEDVAKLAGEVASLQRDNRALRMRIAHFEAEMRESLDMARGSAPAYARPAVEEVDFDDLDDGKQTELALALALGETSETE